MPLRFPHPQPSFDVDRGVVRFRGTDGMQVVRCGVSREALIARAGTGSASPAGLMSLYERYAAEIHALAERVFETEGPGASGIVLLTSVHLNRPG